MVKEKINHPSTINIDTKEIVDKINPLEVHIDSTPNGNYALRILDYYYQRTRERWEVSGLSEHRSKIYDLMNEHQEQRGKELAEAIAKLKSN